jgi:isopenicillin-N epimerase
LIEPLVVSWGTESDTPSGSEFIDHHEWWGTRDIAAFLSVPAAIEFQREHDWNAVQSKCHEMLRQTLASLSRMTGMQSVYPDDSWYAQMGVAPLPETVNASALQARLFDDFGVEVPVRAWNGRILLRLSLQAYNSNDDTDRLMGALQALI